MKRYTNPAEIRTAEDHAEAAAIARHELRRWLDRQGGHLIRSLAVAHDAQAWPRVRHLAWRLLGVALVGELAS